MKLYIIGNRYKIISEIGRTDTSIVHIGKDLKSKSEAVAIKTLTLRNTENDVIKELFKRECDSLTRLKHANIIRYIDSGIDEEQLYIVMEHFEGCDLYDYVEQNSLSNEDVLKITISILEGLVEAHEKKVIHRDLKPSNILVDDLQNVKIIDFGISKIVGLTYETCNTVKDYMSILYSAPEQLLRYEAKPQSDLFSVGLIICYMISKQEPPKDRGQLMQYINNINCSSELKSIILALTKENSHERPQNSYHVIREIKKEYYRNLSKSKKIYIKFSPNIQRQLYEVGMVDYNSPEHIKNFIREDIEKSSLYKDKNSYLLIGRDIKYTCQISQDYSYLRITRINCLDEQTDWEYEFKRGMELDIPWTVLNDMQSVIQTNDLKDLLQIVIDDEKRRKIKYKREKIQNELLSKWEKYLEEEYSLLEGKKKLCNYKDLNLDPLGTKIIVQVHQLDFIIEKGEAIQLTSKADQQITVGTFEMFENNTIQILMNHDIDIEYISTKGILGIDVIQAQTSVRRLRNAWKSIKFRDSVNPNLPDILNDPFTITINNISPIKKFFQNNLDTSITSAVEKALATKDMFLIQGPPGTGKTTVITEIVCQILNDDPKAKILLTSQSHVAVDHAINKISKILSNNRIIRIGRSDRISEESQNLIMSNQLKSWVSAVKEKSKSELFKYLDTEFSLTKDEMDLIVQLLDKSENDSNNDEINDSILFTDDRIRKIKNIAILAKEWHRRLGKLDEFDEIFANKASIVAATCVGIASRHVLNDIMFDWVIVDEAARATPLELLVPIVRGKKIILVGDHRQLPPVVNLNMDKLKIEEKGLKTSDLEKSLFEELIENIPDEAKVVLTSQFRMHPSISKLIAEVFYPSENIVAKTKAEERNHHLSWWPRAVVWIDTQKLKDCFEQTELFSRRNQGEARAILNTLQYIEEYYRKSSLNSITVGVISGYDAQKSLLNNLINPSNSNKWQKLKIIIDNVDAFQGSETDIVLYSLVRCNKDNKLGFLYDERRLNVALSRGKNCLIIVGNTMFAEKAKSFRGNPFIDIIKYLRKNSDSCLLEVFNEY